MPFASKASLGSLLPIHFERPGSGGAPSNAKVALPSPENPSLSFTTALCIVGWRCFSSASRDHAPAVGLSGGFEARLSRAWLSGLVTGAPVSARAGRLGSGVAVSGWAGTERWGVSDRRHARQPVEDKMHQRRGEACARQVERNAGFQLDDASGNLDEAQAEGVELGAPPGRSFRQSGA